MARFRRIHAGDQETLSRDPPLAVFFLDKPVGHGIIHQPRELTGQYWIEVIAEGVHQDMTSGIDRVGDPWKAGGVFLQADLADSSLSSKTRFGLASHRPVITDNCFRVAVHGPRGQAYRAGASPRRAGAGAWP